MAVMGVWGSGPWLWMVVEGSRRHILAGSAIPAESRSGTVASLDVPGPSMASCWEGSGTLDSGRRTLGSTASLNAGAERPSYGGNRRQSSRGDRARMVRNGFSCVSRCELRRRMCNAQRRFDSNFGPGLASAV